jgi:lipoprotein NlpI
MTASSPASSHAAASPVAAAPLPPLRKNYRLNGRLLLGTLVVAGLMTVLAQISRGHFLARNAEMFLARAEQASGEGQVLKALQFYNQYLKLTAGRGEMGPAAAQRRAEILLKTGELQEAVATSPEALRRALQLYEEAARLHATSSAPRRKLIPLLTRLERYTDALDHIKALEQHTDDPHEAAELAFRAGRCYELLNDLSQAQARYSQSLAHDPKQSASYLALARLWSARPSAERFSVKTDRTPNWPELEVMLATRQPGDPLPTLAAIVLLLDRMVAERPGYESELIRAKALSELQIPLDATPLPLGVAQSRVDADILSAADRDADLVLSGDERWHVKVPALADANGDQQITRDELAARLSLGDQPARLREAERVLTHLTQLVPENPQLLAEARLALIGLFTARLNSADQLSPDERKSLHQRMRDLVQRGMEQPRADPRFRLMLVQLELRELSPTDQPEELQAKLDAVEQLLRTGLSELKEEDVQPRPFDEWHYPWSQLEPWAAEAELEYQLAQLYILRAAALRHDAAVSAALLAQAQEIVDKLRRQQIDVHTLLLLEFRAAWLSELRAEGAEKAAIRQNKLLPMAARLGQAVGKAGSMVSRDAAALLGNTYLRLNNLGAALDIYRRQIKADPFWMDGRLAVANILTQLGRTDEAILEYQKLLSVPTAAENLAKLLLLRQLQRPPEERDWKGLDVAVSAAAQTTKDPARAAALRAEVVGIMAATGYELAELRGDPSLGQKARDLLAEEEQRLRQALQEHPRSAELWAALAQLPLRRGDLPLPERRDAVQQLLREAREQTGPRVELAQVELLLALQHPPDSALPLIEQLAAAVEELPPEGRVNHTLALAEALQQLNQFPQALRFMQQQAARNPHELDFQVRLLQLLLLNVNDQPAGWEAEWTAALARLEALEGMTNGTSAILRAQRILAERSSSPEDRAAQLRTARELLIAAGKTRPHVAAIPRSLGLLEEEAGNLNAAVDAYNRAVELGDLSQLSVSRLVNLYYTRNINDKDKRAVDMEAAHRLLERVAAQRPQAISGNLARLAWQVELNRGQLDRAALIAAQVASQSNDPRDIVTDLVLEFERGEQSEAVLQKFRDAAYHRAPRSGLTWFMLVRYLVRAQRWTDAEQAILDAEPLLTAERTANAVLSVASLWELLAAADGPERTRWLAEATRRYDAALTEFPNDTLTRVQALDHFLQTGANERAQALITYLLDPVRAVPPDVRALVRRRQAVLEARSGSYGDTLKAIAALQQLRKAGGDQSPENLRLELRLLQRLREVDTKAEQKPLLLALEQQGKLTREEHLQLAQLLTDLDEWDAAETRYKTFLAAYPQYVGGRLSYAAALLKQAATRPELLDAVSAQLEELKALEPRSFRTLALEAQYLAARGDAAAATALVQSLVETRLAAKGEARFRVLLEQENVQELFQTLGTSGVVRNRRDIFEALQAAWALVRRGQTEQAARSLANGPAAGVFDDLLRGVSLQAARLVEAWDAHQAAAFYRTAVTTTSGRQAPIELARLLVNTGAVDEALTVCEEHWTRMTPAGVALILSLIARRNEPQHQAKLAVWEERVQSAAAGSATEDQPAMYMYLGNYANELGRYDAAVAHYQRAKGVEELRYVPLNNFAFLSARLGQNLEEAAAAIDAALQIAGPRRELVDTKATVLLALNRAEEARDYLRQSTVSRTDPLLLFRLAECYYRLKDRAAARSTLDSALQQGLQPETLHPLDRPLLAEMQKLLAP